MSHGHNWRILPRRHDRRTAIRAPFQIRIEDGRAFVFAFCIIRTLFLKRGASVVEGNPPAIRREDIKKITFRWGYRVVSSFLTTAVQSRVPNTGG
jgi:hypothetical protein